MGAWVRVGTIMVCAMLMGGSDAWADGLKVCARATDGSAIAGAVIEVKDGGYRRFTTDATGCAAVEGNTAKGVVRVTHDGYASVEESVDGKAEIDAMLSLAKRVESVEVTARTPLALDASASSVRTMTTRQMQEAPSLVLDERLRQVAGFQLFRRTSSWVANPTTEGTSLRGLGSTAASRTLVLSDLVPLNDSFGGWIHWNEIPELAIRQVELMRGGASDLYGSSAIGGVIDVVPVESQKSLVYAANVMGASETTVNGSGLLAGGGRMLNALGAVTLFRTDGYILTAPESRGAVDVASNVRSESGRVEMRHEVGSDGAMFLRGNLLNEARSNGTPLQTNATRVWRYVAGTDFTAGEAGRMALRLHGMDQGYRQSFSSIAADRSTERLTRLQVVPSQQMGGVLQWARSWRALTVVAGSDVLDTRGTDNETPVSNGVRQTTQSTSARQRDTGVYGEALWQPRLWSIAFSSRVDRFDTFDARSVGVASPPVLPNVSETIFDPRLGVVRQVGGGVSLTASAFRAFRGPSLNELYRTGQVGQQTTLANPALRSERATGWEVGGLMNLKRFGEVRSSYFWTQVNRPVAAVALSTTPTSQLLMRENLGQLESRGVMAEADVRPVEFLTITAGYQYANSTVTKFQSDPTLVGRWTPQVPRNSATLQARMERRRWGVFDVDLRTSGQQFDDSANMYRLNGYAQVDLYAEHAFGDRLRVYASAQNLLNSRIEAGRTPVLTLAAPRVVAVGVRLH